jgi:hypothetical protein
MKKNLFFAALLCACLFAGVKTNAQSVTANVSVTLADVLDIHIGTASGTSATIPAFNFNSATAYQDGVTQEFNDHLFVVASKAFQIKVSSTDLTYLTNTISAAGLTVLGANGSTGATGLPAGTTYATLSSLSSTPTAFITATGGTSLYKYKVSYIAGGAGRASEFLGKANGTYSATITYTIEP